MDLSNCNSPHFNLNIQAGTHRAENSREVVHAGIALRRQHAMQALAGLVGQRGQLLKTDGSVHEVAQNVAGSGLANHIQIY